MREIIYYEELQELKPYAVELPEVRGPLPDTDESYSFNAANICFPAAMSGSASRSSRIPWKA